MEPARVYKTKIRENILRQVIFTDRNLLLGTIIVILLFVWKTFSNVSADMRIFISLSLAGTTLLIFTLKTDRQILIKIFPRIINFIFSKKETRN